MFKLGHETSGGLSGKRIVLIARSIVPAKPRGIIRPANPYRETTGSAMADQVIELSRPI
jgi:hypothetical protein